MRLIFLSLLSCRDKSDDAPENIVYNYIEETNGTLHASEDYKSAESCGECHPVHYQQWKGSMHAYATRSPVFEKMAQKAYRDSAGEVGEFCTRCHSIPGDSIGEDGTYGYDSRSDIGKEGVTCVTCHQAEAHFYPIGNANLEVDPFGMIYGPFESTEQREHASMKSDLLQSPELCGSCHDVFMYPGIAIEQAYSEYVNSPAAETGERCQDCHMTPNPGVTAPKTVAPIAVVDGFSYPDRELSDHYFTGPDYVLVDDWPYDSAQENQANRIESLARTQQLLENSIEIGLVQANITNNELNIDVLLRSLVDGHNVPTGFTSERQLWVEIIVSDRNQNIVFQTGDLDSYGDLRDVHSWDVLTGEVEEDSQLVNLQSTNQIIQRHYLENGENDPTSFITYEEAVFPFQAITIIRNSLEPREERNLRYHVSLLQDEGPYTIETKLRYRNLPPYVLRELQLDDLSAKLQIFDIDQETKLVH